MAADVAERDATSGGMRLSRGLSLGASRDQIPHPTHGGRVGSLGHHPWQIWSCQRKFAGVPSHAVTGQARFHTSRSFLGTQHKSCVHCNIRILVAM